MMSSGRKDEKRKNLKAAERIMETLVRLPPQPHKDVPTKRRASAKEKPSRQPPKKENDGV